MQFAFSAPHIKIQRAQKHLAELESEIAAFQASPPPAAIDASISFGLNGTSFAFSFPVPSVPEHFGAIVGDIIHNLRTALDLTACEMVRVAGQDDKDVYFPFCERVEDLDFMIRKRRFDRAGPEAVALLNELKPYKGGNTPLRLIHDLDIHDKHRALIPHAMAVASPVIELWGYDEGQSYPRIIGDPNRPSEFKWFFPGESGSDGRELLPTLHELVKLITDVVVAFRDLANCTRP